MQKCSGAEQPEAERCPARERSVQRATSAWHLQGLRGVQVALQSTVELFLQFLSWSEMDEIHV